MALGQVHEPVGEDLDDARLLQAAHDNKQAGEEEDGGPLYARDDFLDVLVPDEQHDGGGGQGDGAGF